MKLIPANHFSYAHEGGKLVLRANPDFRLRGPMVRRMNKVGVVASSRDGLLFHGSETEAKRFMETFTTASREHGLAKDADAAHMLTFKPGDKEAVVLNKMISKRNFAADAIGVLQQIAGGRKSPET